jgi:hypothetical protein
MPQVSSELAATYWEPVATGPVAMADYSSVTVASPQGTIAASGNFTTAVIPSDGFKLITLAATSSQAGALNIQLYIDKAGTIKQGAVQTVALTAATPAILNVNGALTPFQSFTAQITNTGGSAATVTNYALVMTAA